jgi:hypothetical protein
VGGKTGGKKKSATIPLTQPKHLRCVTHLFCSLVAAFSSLEAFSLPLAPFSAADDIARVQNGDKTQHRTGVARLSSPLRFRRGGAGARASALSPPICAWLGGPDDERAASLRNEPTKITKVMMHCKSTKSS